MTAADLISDFKAQILSGDEGARIQKLVDRGALFVVNHSGGKDSQAMHVLIREIVPPEQIAVIHAELPEVDWEGIPEHIENTLGGNFPIIYTRSRKMFLEMVEHRGMFPSPQQRQCTSDLKRGPIEREIRRHLKENPQFNGLVVSCTGIRAEESASRAKQKTLRYSERNSKAGREWYEWMPIHAMSVLDVFATIATAGESPHWAYGLGMTRLSCVFCIMSSKHDLITAAKLRPQLYKRYVNMEKFVGRTMMMPVNGVPMTLEQITGIDADENLQAAA